MEQATATDTGDDGVWTERFRVRSYEADARGVVTPASLCNYLQEAAGNHAFKLDVSVEQLLKRNLTWMLSRLRLQMERLPRWRETVEVETWPVGFAGILALRDFLIRCDGEVVGRASTAWLLIDVTRRRPARPTDEVRALPRPNRDPALPFPSTRLPAPEHLDSDAEVAVRWSDMDVNEHTNNVRYVAWAMDALPEAILRDARMMTLAVEFLGESRAQDLLRVRSSSTSEERTRRFLTELVLAAGEKPVARVESLWAPAPAA